MTDPTGATAGVVESDVSQGVQGFFYEVVVSDPGSSALGWGAPEGTKHPLNGLGPCNSTRCGTRRRKPGQGRRDRPPYASPSPTSLRPRREPGGEDQTLLV